jgi:predicted PurR-regulated permease PerM
VSLRLQAAFWIAALVVLLVFLWVFSSILLPFILGIALAYLLDPLADRLQGRGMNRFWATITIVLVTLLIIAVVVLIAVPVLVSQAADFIAHLPEYIARFNALSERFFDSRIGQYFDFRGRGTGGEQAAADGASWLTTVVTSLWTGGRAVIGTVSLVFVTPVVAFYLLYDWDRMIARFDTLIPRDYVDNVRRIAREIDAALSGFIRGQSTVCLFLGAFYAVALTALGLNFGFLIGVVTGIISFIPFVGSLVGFVLSVGMALAQFWPEWAWVLAVAGVFVVGQFIEGNILQPRLVGSSIGVHPVWLMFSLFAFGALFGFVGILLAVPITAALGVIVRFSIEQYRRSALFWGREGGPPEDRLL